jgi:hypothetical protein
MAVCIAAVLLLPGCKGEKVPARWTAQQVEIDGRFGDWSDLGTTYLEEQQAVFGIANDSTHLYLMLRFKEPQRARLIRLSGLTVWLDPSGGSDRKFVLTYTGGPTREQMAEAGVARGMPDNQQPSPEMAARLEQIEANRESALTLEIVDRLARMPISPDGTVGPKAASGIDQGFFCYEFSIPLAEGEVRDYGLGVVTGADIGVGARWGGLPDELRQRMGGRPGGGMRCLGGGRGGMRPGGGTFSGGEPGGQSREQMREMVAEQEVAFSIRLADRTSGTDSAAE